jgi:tetraacyldisaccharide 4'-kinase
VTLSGDYYRALVSGQRRGLGPGLLRCGLRVASVPYGLVTRIRNRLYDTGWKPTHPVPIPVVSIGNLTLGGTGKTPCVEYVARFYREQNRRVAILSRGYGSSQGRNDEALVLEENLPDVPHLQGADRVALAAIAVEELESEILVLDDGFQHRRLARNLDLVLIDTTQPWGHGYLFPRGLLREARTGLRRAGAVLLTRCDQVEDSERAQLRQVIAGLAPEVPIVETRHQALVLVNSEQATRPLKLLAERPVAAFCGIGNPEAFRQTLLRLGASLCAFRSFSDHHPYCRQDVEDLRTWASQLAPECLVVTTQKDLVKLRLPQLGSKEVWALRIGLHFDAGQETLDRKLKEVSSQELSQKGFNPF